jgi:hypothetical protein
MSCETRILGKSGADAATRDNRSNATAHVGFHLIMKLLDRSKLFTHGAEKPAEHASIHSSKIGRLRLCEPEGPKPEGLRKFYVLVRPKVYETVCSRKMLLTSNSQLKMSLTNDLLRCVRSLL